MTQFISIGGSPSYLLASIGPSVYSETRLFTYQELTNALADKLVSPSLLAIDFVNIKLLLAAVAPGSPFHSQHYHCCRTASNSAGLQVATQLHTGIAISRNISTPMTDVGTGEIKVIRDGECVSRISAEDYNSLLTQESRIAYLELLNPNAYHFGTAASRKMGDSIAITIEDEAACELLAIPRRAPRQIVVWNGKPPGLCRRCPPHGGHWCHVRNERHGHGTHPRRQVEINY
jgi:hypothetical protein